MRFVLIAIAVFLMLNLTYAQQQLNKGYFIYENLTVGNGGSIVVGTDTTSNIDLFVMPSSNFSSFINDGSYSTFYNNSVGTGIFQINVSPGKYVVVFQAIESTKLDASAIAVPYGDGHEFVLNGEYTYNFTLSNYSNVNVALLAAGDYSLDPVVVNISGTQANLSENKNLYRSNITENRGPNNVTIIGNSPIQMFLVVNSTPQLVNPLLNVYSGDNYSVGVASYGLYNISGTLYPYQIKTDEIVGVANITSMVAYNPNPPANSSVGGASLQLNVNLNTYVNNEPKVFWLQDVVDFNTSSNEYYLLDNIWNNTAPSSSVNESDLVGSGNVSVCTSCGNQTFYVDTYPNDSFNYTFPIDMKLIILENQTSNGSEVSFGYQILRNGSYGVEPLVFFDHVIIPGSSNSTLLVTPYYQTKGNSSAFGDYYDSEFVFGGESNGANTQFDLLNSSIWIYYDNKSVLTPFPSVYTFGLDTAETASNLRALPGVNGAVVTPGPQNLTEDIFTTNALSLVGTYLSNTSKYSTVTTTINIPTPPETSKISSAEKYAFVLIIGVALVFIIIVGYFLIKKN